MAAPTWAPTLVQVANHIPTRTRAIGISDSYTGTFNADTTPTATQVTALIEDACVWAAGPAGVPIVTAAEEYLRLAATLWCAYQVELAYPERDADVTVYDRFRVDAESARDTAAAVNRANGGGATVDEEGQPPVLAVYEFPDPPPWADVHFL